MALSPTNGISKLSVQDTEQPIETTAPSETTPPGGVHVGENGAQTSSEAAATSAATEGAAVGGSDNPAPKQRTVCGVCETEVSKYKCPHCAVAYCSVVCARIHREAHPPDSIPPRPRGPAGPVPTAAATNQQQHPFSVLEHAPELKRLFTKYPNLRSTLNRIHSATLPPPGTSTSLPLGGAVGGGSSLPWSLADVQHRIDVANGKHNNNQHRKKREEPWSQDVGLRRGKAALRKARMDPGEDGDGVREYCELVLYLLSRDGPSGQQDRAAAMVRHEVTQEELKLIEHLQLQESGD